jgi:hypothetical protein
MASSLESSGIFLNSGKAKGEEEVRKGREERGRRRCAMPSRPVRGVDGEEEGTMQGS